ncbi:MAG TPA: outer membrane beta-barrel domain-containing protein [Burkholderiaceae bacterium]|nr:outer membrane beta-barrel domain-containing protein [Burkholderiaceae bacterium]
MNHKTALLTIAMLAIGANAFAADAPAKPTDQVVVPQVDRRDISVPRLPSNDFEIGAFVGTYATQNFGSSAVGGLRLGYHVTEDFFVEGVYAQTKVSDESFRQVLPGGVFPDEKEKLSYYNLSVGYNVLPGEVFIGGKRAKPSAFYLIGGVGSTKFDQQRRPTYNVGAGLRVFLGDRIALQVDARDHIFSLDLLGKRQSTQNLEFSAGITAFF